MYVKATSAERFLESAESFTSWFGGESACYVMAPGEDRENLGFWNRERARLFRESGGKEGSLAWLRHCWIDFKDKVPNWWVSGISIVFSSSIVGLKVPGASVPGSLVLPSGGK